MQSLLSETFLILFNNLLFSSFSFISHFTQFWCYFVLRQHTSWLNKHTKQKNFNIVSRFALFVFLLSSSSTTSTLEFDEFSDGKVRIYRLSSAIRRLSQESRWQPLITISQHKEAYPISLIPTPRNRQRRHQQLFISIKPKKIGSALQLKS